MGRFGLAMRVLFNGKFAAQVSDALDSTPKLEEKKPAPAPKPKPPKPKRSDAISLLATLQREARLVDFLQESIDDYDDAQIGAAVRDVHRESRKVLERLFDLQPVVDQEDGTSVDVPKDSAGRYQLTGNVSEDRAASGTLVHPGWRASRCELPKWTGSDKAALVLAPAEVEI